MSWESDSPVRRCPLCNTRLLSWLDTTCPSCGDTCPSCGASYEYYSKIRSTKLAKLKSQHGASKKWLNLVKAVARRDGWHCHYCGKGFNPNRINPNITLDHRIPKALGGRYTVDNLQLACRPCNESVKRDVHSNAIDEALVRIYGIGRANIPSLEKTKLRFSERFTCAQCRQERIWGKCAQKPDGTLSVVCLRCAKMLKEAGFVHEEEA